MRLSLFQRPIARIAGAAMLATVASLPTGKAKAQEALTVTPPDAITITTNFADRANGDFIINTPAELRVVLANNPLAEKLPAPEGAPFGDAYRVPTPEGYCGFATVPLSDDMGEQGMIIADNQDGSTVLQAFAFNGQLMDLDMEAQIEPEVTRPVTKDTKPAEYPAKDGLINRCLRAFFLPGQAQNP